LISFQKGFLRCVRCIGEIDRAGRCQARPGQGGTRADRYADGDYDADTGECRSNLRGRNALFETYFPIGALDARRGVVKGPDAIIDTRSLPPGEPVKYIYELPVDGVGGPYRVEARLLFRAFPPYLIAAFAEHEAAQHARGLRPSGPLVTREAVERLDVVEIASAQMSVPGRLSRSHPPRRATSMCRSCADWMRRQSRRSPRQAGPSSSPRATSSIGRVNRASRCTSS
jgi:hypothetical protein